MAETVEISGTPTFVLGRLKGGQITGKVFVGVQSVASFTAEIEALLRLTK